MQVNIWDGGGRLTYLSGGYEIMPSLKKIINYIFFLTNNIHHDNWW